MGTDKIAVCYTCKQYLNLNRILSCWDGDFWEYYGYDDRIKEYDEEYSKRELVHELLNAQMLCRFLIQHQGHDVRIWCEYDDAFLYALFGNLDGDSNEYVLKEVTMEDLIKEIEKEY